MTTAELTRHIERSTGKLFLSFQEIVKLGFGKDTVREMIKGVDYVVTGENRHVKKYYVADVSKMIMERRMLHD